MCSFTCLNMRNQISFNKFCIKTVLQQETADVQKINEFEFVSVRNSIANNYYIIIFLHSDKKLYCILLGSSLSCS